MYAGVEAFHFTFAASEPSCAHYISDASSMEILALGRSYS